MTRKANIYIIKIMFFLYTYLFVVIVRYLINSFGVRLYWKSKCDKSVPKLKVFTDLWIHTPFAEWKVQYIYIPLSHFLLTYIFKCIIHECIETEKEFNMSLENPVYGTIQISKRTSWTTSDSADPEGTQFFFDYRKGHDSRSAHYCNQMKLLCGNRYFGQK